MTDYRRDPDALLARVQQEEARAKRGRLKVFFGAVAGVGKTYSMLEAGRARRRDGIDVVVGYIEAHRRPETLALLDNLEQLPTRAIEYRGATLKEFDLDAALARRPALILVDELAHTNAVDSRHPKRWQDIEELRDAGIDVYTTVNVQHLESLNDVVAQITGIRVRETVPDAIIEGADDVELIDLPPDELLQRLKEGKVYIPEQAQHAVENFFRTGNLIALRELALRRTADRVDAQMRAYRQEHAIDDVWAVRDRLMVCIGPGPLAEHLVRAGKRVSISMRAEWIVVYIETPDLLHLSEDRRDEVVRTLRLAETLGAETVTIAGGRRFSDEVLSYAHARNVTRIIVGKPRRHGWKRWLFGSIVDALVQGSGDIDVQVVGAYSEPAPLAQHGYLARSSAYLGLTPKKAATDKQRWKGYAASVAIVALCTLLAWPMSAYFELSNLVMLYLLAVVVVAVRLGRGPSVVASILAVAAFDFCFVPPYLSFAVSDTQYIVTFAVMLVVALIISTLTASVRLQARVAGHRERRTAALYAMTRELAVTRSRSDMVKAAVRHVSEVFESQVVVLLPDAEGRIGYPQEPSIPGSLHEADLGVGQWVHDHGQLAGLGTDTLPGADALYLPLAGSAGTVGALGVLPARPRQVFVPEQLHLLETFAGQLALALQRVELAEETQRTQLRAESESLRNSLLAAVSHDLRTPLAVIAGAASSLAENDDKLEAAARQDLAQTVYDEARRMTRLVNNLLDMTRLDSGTVKLNLQWCPLEEVAGSVMQRVQEFAGRHPVSVSVPAKLPLVRIDSVLIEQVLVNLVENAVKYTPADTPIEISASADKNVMTVRVEDRGPGIPHGAEERLFDKFYRVKPEGVAGGVGLGLSICRAIVEAHGGRIYARNRENGGAEFSFTLPVESVQPAVLEEIEA